MGRKEHSSRSSCITCPWAFDRARPTCLSLTWVASSLRRAGYPEDFRAILGFAPELRTNAQRELLLSYFHKTDEGWQQKQNAVNASKVPLPDDPKLKDLRDAVAALSHPLPVSSRLVQLRQDVERSIQQAATRRLTAAQDIVWALINSPAFLFNH